MHASTQLKATQIATEVEQFLRNLPHFIRLCTFFNWTTVLIPK